MKKLCYYLVMALFSLPGFSQNAPAVTYVQPHDNFTATPSMHFKIKVADDTNYCTATITTNSSALISSVQFKDSADWDVDLGAYGIAGGIQSLTITVSDKNGQLSARLFNYYTEIPGNFTGLSTFYTGANQILDFNSNKIFALGDYNLQPSIIDLKTNSQTFIPFSQPVYYSQQTVVGPRSAYITNTGAFFFNALAVSGYVTAVTAAYSGVYDWNNGELDSVGNDFVLSRVKDSFAVWNPSDLPEIHLRNFSTQKNILVTDSGDAFYDIGANGLVAFSSTSKQNIFNLFSYKNGAITQLTNDGVDALDNKIKNVYPKTDGQNIAFVKAHSCCGYTDYSLYVNNGVQNTFIADLGSNLIQPTYLVMRSYAISNKYIAFCAPDNAGKTQLWQRNATGNINQLTYFNGYVGGIETTAPNGDIMFFYNNHRYLAQKSGVVHIVSDSIGKSYYTDSAWYIVLGNVIFKYNVNAALPLNLVAFTGTNQGKANMLNWQTTDEKNTASFNVEKSLNTRSFTAIGSVTALSNSSGTAAYNFTDATPADGINYYRLKMIDKDGLFIYSKIISINNGSVGFAAAVLPNPVDNAITLQITSKTAQQLHAELVDINGRVIQTAQFAVANGTTIQTLNAAGLSKGMYLLRINSSAKEPLTLKVVKN